MLKARRLGGLVRAIALSVAVGDAPPTEFRIFKAGENPTTHGTFLFDEQAAQSVMAEYEAHGIDIMIDLEHLSVEDSEKSANYDPDARGWCKLALRNGELWAVNVTWTSDGIARLTDKRQRYISPVFAFNSETKRIMRLLNIALTALPATDDLVPLVAASARDFRKLSSGSSLFDVVKAIQDELDERFPYSWVCDVFDTSVVYEYAGKLWELAYSFDGSEAVLGANPIEVKRTYAPVAAAAAPPTTPAAAASRRIKLNDQGDKTMTPEQLAQLAEVLGLGSDANVEDVLATVAAMVKKVQDAANGTAPANDAPADAPPAAAKDAAPMVAAASMVAASRILVRLSGKKDIGEVVREVEAWQKSHVELVAQNAALAAERATLEASERHRLVAELVKLGAEWPATAWADDKGTKPAEPWASMPLEQLRKRVEVVAKAKGVTPPAAPPRGAGGTAGASLTSRPRLVPAAGSGSSSEPEGQTIEVEGEPIELTAFELQACKDAGAKPEDYARNKRIRLRAGGGRAARSA